MAQIVTALVTNNMKQPQAIQEFYLYNVFGYSNFKAAIDDAIARHVDVISYSEVWEYGGNNDGKGFINAQVSRATAAGITWVNAAGNFGLLTYNSSITTMTEDWVKLPDQNNSLVLRCEKNDSGKCPVKAVLSWNDFKDDVNPGTDKDLDLALTDDMLNIVQTSSLRQSNDPNESRPGYSKYPREILTAELKTGTYFLRIKDRSGNFGKSDRLRISVDGENLTMPSHSTDESLLNPADNPSVITVGALDSDRSSISAKLGKPDLLAPSSFILSNGAQFLGSSNSTAIVAAGVALAKAQNPQAKTKEQILSLISKSYSWDQGGLTIRYFGFLPTAGNCFTSRQWPNTPAYIQSVLSKGGVLVDTTAQARIMLPFDPLVLAPNLARQYPTDMIVVMPNGQFQIYQRNMMIPQGAVEVFQRPYEIGLCQPPAKHGGRLFSL
jgi:subtilisin family serine protease